MKSIVKCFVFASLLAACSDAPVWSVDAGDAGSWEEGGGAGPDGGGSHCSGTPTPCVLLSDSQCAAAAGCKKDERCTGAAMMCFEITDHTTCTLQDGCHWDYSSSSCSGFESHCDTFQTSVSCGDQQGCSWISLGCSGTPIASCGSLGAGQCASVPGCVAK